MASLEGADRATRFDIVGKLGRIRSRKRGKAQPLEFFLDFRPVGRVWSHHGIRLTDEETANRLLEQIRGKVAEDRSLADVLAEYLPATAKPNLVPARVAAWLEVKRRQVETGDRSPTYLRELRRYARPGGEFSWWANRSIHEISYAALEDWSGWLADKETKHGRLSAKTRANILGAFRGFVGWLHRREEIRKVPEFPTVDVPEYLPRIISIEDQAAILAAIPDERRGIFLTLALMGLRPGEARALNVADLHDGWLHVSHAMKGDTADAPRGPTKTKKAKRLPMPTELAEWIEAHVDISSRLTGAALFPHPRTGKRWSHRSLRDTWIKAQESVGIYGVAFYQATKHSFATDALRRGVPKHLIARFLGHADTRSTDLYARLAETELVTVLRPRDLSPACRQGAKTPESVERNHGVKASTTGCGPAGSPQAASRRRVMGRDAGVPATSSTFSPSCWKASVSPSSRL